MAATAGTVRSSAAAARGLDARAPACVDAAGTDAQDMVELVAALAELELTISALSDATADASFSREDLRRALVELVAIVRDLREWSGAMLRARS